MKIRYNRFAVFPVMCHDCHRYIWMEPYRRADVWHNWLDRYVKKTICNECLKKYFNEAEEFVRSKGHIVLNPSFLPEGLADYYKINKAMIDQCDAIYVLLHSENSVGTKKEIEYAKSTCKQVIYQQEAETKEKEWGWKKDPYIYPRSFYSPVGYTPWDPFGKRY